MYYPINVLGVINTFHQTQMMSVRLWSYFYLHKHQTKWLHGGCIDIDIMISEWLKAEIYFCSFLTTVFPWGCSFPCFIPISNSFSWTPCSGTLSLKESLRVSPWCVSISPEPKQQEASPVHGLSGAQPWGVWAISSQPISTAAPFVVPHSPPATSPLTRTQPVSTTWRTKWPKFKKRKRKKRQHYTMAYLLWQKQV